MASAEDLRIVADRLGLKPEDVEDVRQALDEITAHGFEAFVDVTLRDAAIAVEAARSGEQLTDAPVRRTKVRGRIADGMAEMFAQRELLERYDGPSH